MPPTTTQSTFVEQVPTFFMALAGKDGCIHLTGSLHTLWHIKQLTNWTSRNIFKSKQRNSPLQFF